MKKLKQFILPAVIVLLGAGAAFATNTAKASDSDLAIGHYLDSFTGQCISANVQCTTIEGPLCTWTDPATGITHELQALEGTSCGRMLFKP